MVEGFDGARIEIIPINYPQPFVGYAWAAGLHDFIAPGVCAWSFSPPDDGYNYAICNFSLVTNQSVYVVCDITINGMLVFSYGGGYCANWYPCAEKAYFLRFPDEIICYSENLYAIAVTHYSAFDFQRSPA